MGFTTTYLTGLWSRTIKRVTDNENVQFLEITLKERDLERLRLLQAGDMLQIWPNDDRKSDNSPTHNMRFRRETKKTEE